MNGLQIFDYNGRTVRTVEVNNKVMFCGKDVAIILGYINSKKALMDHCKMDGVTFCDLTDSLGRMQKAKFIDEGNMYRLIIHSKLPTAEKFERWVFDEVLPSLRRTGQYNANSDINAVTVQDVVMIATEVVKSLLPALNQQHITINNIRKRKRGLHSKVDMLPDDVRAVVDEIIMDERNTIAMASDYCKSMGIDISESSVQRYSVRLRNE